MSVLYIRDKNGNLVPVPTVSAKSVQQTPLFANSIDDCTDITKLYVLPDGYIYAYVLTKANTPEITIEELTGGYWYGDEWNPQGSTVSLNTACAKRTNIFAVTPGDQLSYRGFGEISADSVVWLNSGKAYISDEQHDARGETVLVTVPEGVAYAWFASLSYTSQVSGVVLDVQWVKCQAAVETYAWMNTGHAFVPADYESRILALEDKTAGLMEGVRDVLNGKNIVYDGDSICAGFGASGGYAALVAAATGGVFVNQAVGGGKLTSSDAVHSVVDNLANLPTDGDLYCFEGGINDFWGNTPIGECSLTDYTGAVDATTICGALEIIFRYALNNFVGKPVCFVITHKVQNTGHVPNTTGKTFRDYRDAMIQVCEKYSIPYYDAFTESGLNGWNEAQSNAYLTGNSAGTADGIHPNVEGYKRYYVPQLIELFRKIMPV